MAVAAANKLKPHAEHPSVEPGVACCAVHCCSDPFDIGYMPILLYASSFILGNPGLTCDCSRQQTADCSQ